MKSRRVARSTASIPENRRTRRRPRAGRPRGDERLDALIGGADASLLDLVDNLLNNGVVISGEALIGVANVDLVYLRLAAVLCATDRLFPMGER